MNLELLIQVAKKEILIQNPRLAAQLIFEQETLLIDALRRGDEAAFTYLIDCHHAAMLRVAMLFCREQNVAEEVVQETWIAVLNGIDRFEGRASLKTWIYSILSNKAKTRGQRESRSVAFSKLSSANEEINLFDPAVDPQRLKEDGWWRDDKHPSPWEITPEAAYESSEIRDCVQRSIASLPPNQRQVITFRDLNGMDPLEVCNILGISETNQRVLLHRARSKVRRALEHYFDEQ